ncbi:MAG: hypothetical protein D6765_10710 [Bacteroidetes bacterium]|nr:MAG: hypothetical protein D6765_10710 [Bacteroidota bacterium]
MKKNWLFALSLLLCTPAFAQQESPAELARRATETLSHAWKLRPEQVPAVLSIQERKFRNLNEIAPLQTEDPELWLAKLRVVQQSEVVSLEKVLDESQLALLRAEQLRLRKERAKLYRQLLDNAAPPEEITRRIGELEWRQAHENAQTH